MEKEAKIMMQTAVQTPIEIMNAAFEERGQQITISTGSYRGHEIHYHKTNCPCPTHRRGDQNPSLCYWEVIDDTGRPSVYFNCWSGNCSKHEILSALGMKSSLIAHAPTTNYRKQPIITLFDLANHTKLPWELLFNLGWHDGAVTFHTKEGRVYKERGVIIPYYNQDGSEFERGKIRLTLDHTDPRFKWSEGDGMIAYGLHRLQKARDAGYIVIVEGESDYATLSLCGIPALGIPGANTIKSTLHASLLDGIERVYIIQEKTDAAGRNFPYDVKYQLVSTGYTGGILRVPLLTLTGAKDANDLYKQHYDQIREAKSLAPFKDAFQQAIDQGNPMDVDTGKQVQSQENLPEFIIEGQMRDQVQKALDLLERSNRNLFIYLSMLSRIAKDENGAPIIKQVDRAVLRNELNALANFYELRKKKGSAGEYELKDAHPPKDLADQILALAPSEWPLPALKSIVEAPVLRSDGSILDKPGHDIATQLYYVPGPNMSCCKVLTNPSQEDAKSAMKRICDLFVDFPFESQADYANMIALLFTPFVRYAVKKDIQMALIDATNPGTGKGLLSIIVSIIATGKSVTPIAAKHDDDEWRKAIFSKLLQSPRIVIIDNIRGVLESASLELVLTGDGIDDRILGQSKSVEAKNTATWMATGNNLLIGGDLARRCYRIRLISQTASPEERSDFKIKDLEQYVINNRSQIVSDILTVARAWYVAGKPMTKNVPNLGTFSNWAKTIGGMLEFAGVDGFQSNRDELRSKNNEEAQEWETFLSTWHSIYGSEWKRASEIAEKIQPAMDQIQPPASPLFDALPQYLKRCLLEKPKTFPVTLSIQLGKRVQTVYGSQGFRLEKDKDPHKCQGLWRVSKWSDNKPPATSCKSEFEEPASRANSQNSTFPLQEVAGGLTTATQGEEKSNLDSNALIVTEKYYIADGGVNLLQPPASKATTISNLASRANSSLSDLQEVAGGFKKMQEVRLQTVSPCVDCKQPFDTLTYGYYESDGFHCGCKHERTQTHD